MNGRIAVASAALAVVTAMWVLLMGLVGNDPSLITWPNPSRLSKTRVNWRVSRSDDWRGPRLVTRRGPVNRTTCRLGLAL